MIDFESLNEVKKQYSEVNSKSHPKSIDREQNIFH